MGAIKLLNTQFLSTYLKKNKFVMCTFGGGGSVRDSVGGGRLC